MRPNPYSRFLTIALALVGASCLALTTAQPDPYERVSTTTSTLDIQPHSHDVLTQHNYPSRIGAAYETILNTSNVAPGSFGYLGHAEMTGRVYAQVLYKQNVNGANLILAATATNDVYAFNEGVSPDGTLALAWHQSLGTAPSAFGLVGCSAGVSPLIGITGTPVISGNTMFLVAETKNGPGGAAQHELHGLDLATGGAPAFSYVPMEPAVAGLSAKNLQRAALTLLSNYLYIAFGQNCDDGEHGIIAVYDVSTSPPTLKGQYNTTASDPKGQGGIWQAGGGPAGDETDPTNVYVATGNGARSNATDETPANEANALVKVNVGGSGVQAVSAWANSVPDTTVSYDSTTGTYSESIPGPPHSQQFTGRGEIDLDLGASGPMLLPGPAGGSPRMLVGGKEGYFFLTDTNMRLIDEFRAAHNGQVGVYTIADVATYDQFDTEGRNSLPAHPGLGVHSFEFQDNFPHIHGPPVYWGDASHGLLYVWGEKDYLRAYAYTPSSSPPFDRVTFAVGSKRIRRDTMPGGNLSVAGIPGGGEPIVFAATPLGHEYWEGQSIPGILRAYAGYSLTELWNSGLDPKRPQDGRGVVSGFPKFCAPTIANGYVYLPNWSAVASTDNGTTDLLVYGLRSPSGIPFPVYNGPDFDGDGQADILWRNERGSTGQNSIWLLHPWMHSEQPAKDDPTLWNDDVSHEGEGYPDGRFTAYDYVSLPSEGAEPNNWHIVGTGDFDQDGRPDIVWSQDVVQNGQLTNQANSVWMGGTYDPTVNQFKIRDFATVPARTDTNWKIRAVGDFNGDGISDLVWRNVATGANAIWIMKKYAPGNPGSVGVFDDPSTDSISDATWDVVGTGDWNHDGVADIVWRNTGTGASSGDDRVWLMAPYDPSTHYVHVQSTVNLQNQSVASRWNIVGVTDYNNDGNPDLIWRNASTGEDSIWLMSGYTAARYLNLQTCAAHETKCTNVQLGGWQIVGPR